MSRDESRVDTPGAAASGYASRDGAGPVSPMRRALAGSAVAAVFALICGTALAQPPAGRMSPEERERLRRELRQQPGQGRGRRNGDRAGDDGQADLQRERMSPQQREQLRRQLREAHASERRGGRRRD